MAPMILSAFILRLLGELQRVSKEGDGGVAKESPLIRRLGAALHFLQKSLAKSLGLGRIRIMGRWRRRRPERRAQPLGILVIAQRLRQLGARSSVARDARMLPAI